MVPCTCCVWDQNILESKRHYRYTKFTKWLTLDSDIEEALSFVAGFISSRVDHSVASNVESVPGIVFALYEHRSRSLRFDPRHRSVLQTRRCSHSNVLWADDYWWWQVWINCEGWITIISNWGARNSTSQLRNLDLLKKVPRKMNSGVAQVQTMSTSAPFEAGVEGNYCSYTPLVKCEFTRLLLIINPLFYFF